MSEEETDIYIKVPPTHFITATLLGRAKDLNSPVKNKLKTDVFVDSRYAVRVEFTITPQMTLEQADEAYHDARERLKAKCSKLVFKEMPFLIRETVAFIKAGELGMAVEHVAMISQECGDPLFLRLITPLVEFLQERGFVANEQTTSDVFMPSYNLAKAGKFDEAAGLVFGAFLRDFATATEIEDPSTVDHSFLQFRLVSEKIEQAASRAK